MKPKHCPLCKFRETGVYYDKQFEAWVVACRNCGCNIQRETKNSAIEAWNRRVKP